MNLEFRILLADDEDIIHRSIGDYLRKSGHHVDGVKDGIAALDALRVQGYDLALVDLLMPGMGGLTLLGEIREAYPDLSTVIITGHGTMENAIEALRLGAADFLTKPVHMLELDAIMARLARFFRLNADRQRLRETIGGMQALDQLRERWTWIGTSDAAQDVREQVRLAAQSTCPTTLITGETGVGKEVVAREIHALAGPTNSPFISVTCPALPEALVESELFGHVKGAFTGAERDRAGYFEIAEGGTLFLDEIADLDASVQAAFLGVLDRRAFRRVGGSHEVRVDCRVIAATNAPLETLVETGRFRRDLYYRLNVFRIHVPPLRERREDIPSLAEHFLSVRAAASGHHLDGFSREAIDLLLGYDYPGNARELRNVVERASILCRSGQIRPQHIRLLQAPADIPGALPVQTPEENPERARLVEALEAARWNRRQAARDLGITYSALRYRMGKFGLL